MDIIQHAAWGFLITRAAENSLGISSLPVEAGAIFLAALPDVIGAAEKILTRNPVAWKWYRWSHCLDLLDCPRWLRMVFRGLRLLPPYALHLWMDKSLHEPFHRWWVYDEMLWAEIFGWTGVIIALGIIH
jgi:hypothetical protein